MQALDNISVVLVEPTHPGNIGAVARAMKTMGLSRLTLVNPKKFPHLEATKRAAGAESVLLAATVVADLQTAVNQCTLVLGTSVRDREVSWPTATPSVAARGVLQHANEQQANQVAIVFGRESSGLANHELDLCQQQIRIPANAEYSSLNLASAVQIICYELRVAALQCSQPWDDDSPKTRAQMRQAIATKAQLDGYFTHLQETLEYLDFIKSSPPTMLMRKLIRLYNKAELTVEEIQILRGILTAIHDRRERS